MHRSVPWLKIPDGSMAHAARDFIRGIETELLYNHSHRVFAFGCLSGAKLGMSVDHELLYVSALFHRVGLTEGYRSSKLRFEVDGANAARQFLAAHDISVANIQEVWDAIALHTTPGITIHKSPLVALLTRGVETDMFGLHLDELSNEQKKRILAAYGRGERFKEDIIEALGAGMLHRPETTFGTVNADVLDRMDPNYLRRNFCGLVLGTTAFD